jgi:hypothetical protein
MRIWSLHPKYLDTKGLVALWREALLAKNVLEGKTKGYKFHPQLNRFRQTNYPVDMINQYLGEVYLEAVNRNFHFDKQKINWRFRKSQLLVTTGQIHHEAAHLLLKLENRDYDKYIELKSKITFDNHPIFKLVDGEIEEWEKRQNVLKKSVANKK